MTAFFMNAALYKTLGFALPGAPDASTLTGIFASQMTVNIFCGVVFGLCIIFAFILGCRPKDYWRLLVDPDQVTSFSGTYGNSVMLMNVGVYGLMILAYYNAIGVEFNGVTFGIIFCMLACCNSGSHPGNVWPIMAGYVVTSFLFGWISSLLGGSFAMSVNAQAIAIGLCYANGLSPIADKYGWGFGMLAAGLHYLLVTSVPNLHGGFCLYNGGFTAALVCIFLLPKLEKYCQLKEPVKQRKSEDGHYDGKFKGPNPVHMGPVHEVVHDASELVHHAGELMHIGHKHHEKDHKDPDKDNKSRETK
jgi:hypothetical protein